MVKISKSDSAVVRAYLDKKVRDFDKVELISLGATLMAIAKDLGVKKSPNDIELSNLVGFVNRNFKDFSITEIKKAFDLVLAGKIPIDDDKKEHYQTFNSKYLGHILVKYRFFRANSLREFDRIATEEEKAKKEAYLKSPEYRKDMYEGLLERISDGVIPDGWNFTAVFIHMYKSDLIAENEVDLDIYMDCQFAQLQSDLKKAKETGLTFKILAIQTKLTQPKAFTAHCQAQWVRDWAQKQLNKK